MISYQERCNLLDNNPLLVARYFQWKFEAFFKETILDGLLRKTKHCPIRVQFQERGSPYFYSCIPIFNAPIIQNETAYINFIEKTINTKLAEYFKDPKHLELVKIYQVHPHSRTCWEYNDN